jgi:polyisoprenyl-phosphate glycosyltransferase
MALISVVLSFRNEQESIPIMIDRLEASLGGMADDYEIIYVNDDSTDKSLEVLTERHSRNPRVKVINLARRFGVEPGIFAGMAYARGDAVVTIDADLQDPPEVIPELVRLWHEGADVVYTVRTKREGESWVKLFLTAMAYRLINRMADIHIPLNAGDFRLMSRRVVDALSRMTEPNTYLRGLVQWVGFKRVPYFYVRAGRSEGRTHFGIAAPLSAVFYGITGFSALPVYAIVVVGFLVTVASVSWLIAIGIAALFGLSASALTVLLPLALSLWGGLVTAIGIVGLYVTRIFRITLARPRFLVDSTVGMEQNPSRSKIE